MTEKKKIVHQRKSVLRKDMESRISFQETT